MNLAAQPADLGDNVFLIYVIALGVSGLLQLVIGAVGFGASGGVRALSALFGAGFLGYAIYLAFFFEGGTYQMFYYAFIAPIFFIVQVVRSRSANRQEEASA